MQELIEIGLAFVDLVKAEWERSKRALFTRGIVIGLILTALFFISCGIGLTLYSAYLGLLSLVDQKWAVFLTGLGALGCAGILLWMASLMGRRRP